MLNLFEEEENGGNGVFPSLNRPLHVVVGHSDHGSGPRPPRRGGACWRT